MEKINNQVAEIKKAIKNGTYDWNKAIEHTADRIMDYPQSLLYRKYWKVVRICIQFWKMVKFM